MKVKKCNSCGLVWPLNQVSCWDGKKGCGAQDWVAVSLPTPSQTLVPAGSTLVVCVLDRSGSMAGIRDSAISSFNDFLTEQQQLPDEAYLTLVLFDDQYEVLLSAAPIADVEPLTDSTFVPRGSTALLDAIGKSVSTVDPDCEKVIVAILTDGKENASQEWNRHQIFGLISDRRDKHNWEFIFLAADQDVIATATSYGVHHAAAFTRTAKGMRTATRSMGLATSAYRTTGAVDPGWAIDVPVVPMGTALPVMGSASLLGTSGPVIFPDKESLDHPEQS